MYHWIGECKQPRQPIDLLALSAGGEPAAYRLGGGFLFGCGKRLICRTSGWRRCRGREVQGISAVVVILAEITIPVMTGLNVTMLSA